MDNKNSQDTIKEFVQSLLNSLEIRKDVTVDKHKVYRCLKAIVDEHVTVSYSFNLAMEFLAETPNIVIMKPTEELLEEMTLQNFEDDENVYFAAYYLLSLMYKKSENAVTEKLAALVMNEKYENAFVSQPLFHEVESRYYKRVGDFSKALDSDIEAINILNMLDVVNLGVYISYASTVCRMLEEDLKPQDSAIEKAKEYIERAIEFNPDYPKYYYLKAVISFYSNASTRDLSIMKDSLETAIELIRKAKAVLFAVYNGKSRFRKEQKAAYDAFVTKITEKVERIENPKYSISNKDLDVLKANILKEKSQDSCVSKGYLPPLPYHMGNEKYFFICYSSRDFKAVYSDMIELYKNKVPFRYDSALNGGENWESQVEKYIQDDRCVGVVFYISKNMLCTESVSREVDITLKYSKKGFSVNLEGSTTPSEILKNIFKEEYSKNPDKVLRMAELEKHIKFRSFFDDKDVFLARLSKVDGTEHIAGLVQAITRKFSKLIVGE